MVPLKIIKIASTESTNSYAEKLLSQRKIDTPVCIVAIDQTSGKGLEQNNWESEPGKNLTISIVCFPEFLPATKQFTLNKTVALAVFDTLKLLLPNERIHIKWPNDIYINNKKAAGILIQTSVQGQRMNWAIIGIGININQKTFPKNIPNPASVIQYKNTESDLDKVLDNFIKAFNKCFSQLEAGKIDWIDKQYLENLYLINSRSKYIFNGKKNWATIVGVNQYGWLKLSVSDGKIIECDMKQVQFIIGK